MSVALVTGANRGIGLEITRQLAARDWRVIMAVRRPEKAEAAISGLPHRSGRLKIVELDLSAPDHIATLPERLGLDRLDVLINNAAIMPDGAGIREVDMGDVRKAMQVNVMAPLQLSQVLLPLLDRSPNARIINISSGMGSFSELAGGHLAYRLTKTALNSLSVIAAKGLSTSGIKVFAMCPGWVRTDMGGPEAPGTVAQGADTAVWLANSPLPESGKFYRNREVIDW